MNLEKELIIKKIKTVENEKELIIEEIKIVENEKELLLNKIKIYDENKKKDILNGLTFGIFMMDK